MRGMGRMRETRERGGNVLLEVREPDGRLACRRRIRNTICTAGKNLLLDATSPRYVKDYSYVAIGSGGGGAGAGDTALASETARASASLSSVADPANSAGILYTARAVFGPGVATGVITESCLDSAASPSGAILAKAHFAGVSKSAVQTLTVTWKIG